MSIKKPVPTSPENLRAIAAELARCATEIEGLAKAIKDAGFQQVRIPNFGQLQNSAKFSNNYLAAGRNALWGARQDRGDFGDVQNAGGKGKKKSVSGKSKKSPKTKGIRLGPVSESENGEVA